MNERIQQLAEQADIFINKSNCVESGNGTEIIGWHIEKFAELIVRECADLADTAEPFQASDLIKKHFGIEE